MRHGYSSREQDLKRVASDDVVLDTLDAALEVGTRDVRLAGRRRRRVVGDEGPERGRGLQSCRSIIEIALGGIAEASRLGVRCVVRHRNGRDQNRARAEVVHDDEHAVSTKGVGCGDARRGGRGSRSM